MMSVCVVSVCVCAKSWPTSGRSLSPGTPSSTRPLVVANQAGEHVGLAVPQPDDRVDLAVAERRQAAEAGARDALHRDLQRQRHLVVVMRARRDVDVHADVLVVERGDRLLRRAAGGDRREGRDRHRHAFAEPRLRRHAFGRAQLRVRERRACSCRSSAAGSRAPAGWPGGRRPASGCAASASVSVLVGAGSMPIDAVDAGRARRRDLQPVFLQPRAIDLEQLDVDDHFGPRLVDRRDQRGPRPRSARACP